MASRFWVGGSASWDSTAGTKWATTSGGAGGAAIPTSADDVFLDGASGANTVTIAAGNTGCLSLDCTGFTGTLTGGTALTISGGLTLVAGMTLTYNGAITFNATAGTKVITSNGVSNFRSAVTFNGAGGTFQLGDAFSTGGAMTLTAGTFDANAKLVTLNANGVSIAGSQAVSGAFTFASLTRTGGSNTFCELVLSAGITVTGTFTATGNSASNRLMVRSDTAGTARTITAAVVSLTDVDFQDITGAGAASPFTGTRIGDCKGNSGITMTAGANKFWVGNTANWNSTSWALTSGGAAAANNYPLPQDTSIFDANSFSANSQTVTLTVNARIGGIDASAVTKTGIGIAQSNGATAFGNILGNAGVSFTGNSAVWTFSGRAAAGSPQTIDKNGGGWDKAITVDSFGGVVKFNSALSSVSGFQLSLTSGTLDMNGQATSFGSFSSNNTNTRAITSGGATLTLIGNAAVIWAVPPLTGFTLNDSLQIDCTYSGATGTRTLNHGNVSGGTETNCPSVKISAGTDIISLSSGGTCCYKNVDFTGFAGSDTNGARTIYGNLTIAAGMTVTAGANATTFGATSGTKSNTSNGKTLDYPVTFNGVGGTWQLADAMTVGSTRTTTLTNGTLDVNGLTLSTGRFSSSNANARTIKSTAAGGKIATADTTAATVFDCTTGTNLTVTRNSWTIEIGGNTANTRTFAGGGKTWPALTFTNTTASGELDFTGSNTFKSVAVSVPPQAVKMTAGTTTTIEDANGFPSGTAGNLVTIGSITAASHALAKSGGGTVTCDYVSVSRSDASPANTWFATHSTNGGNNTGWTFQILLTASAGAFVLSGQAANFQLSDKIIANAGAFTLTGKPAGFLRGYRLIASAGAFALAGNPVPGLPYVHASWESRGRSVRVPAPAVMLIRDERRVVKVTA